MEGQGRPATVVKCEKHGLHYDSAKYSGCIKCRREAGELPPVQAAASAATSASSGSLAQALAVTFLLLALTAFVLHTIHIKVVDSIKGGMKERAAPGAVADPGEQDPFAP